MMKKQREIIEALKYCYFNDPNNSIKDEYFRFYDGKISYVFITIEKITKDRCFIETLQHEIGLYEELMNINQNWKYQDISALPF